MYMSTYDLKMYLFNLSWSHTNQSWVIDTVWCCPVYLYVILLWSSYDVLMPHLYIDKHIALVIYIWTSSQVYWKYLQGIWLINLEAIQFVMYLYEVIKLI